MNLPVVWTDPKPVLTWHMNREALEFLVHSLPNDDECTKELSEVWSRILNELARRKATS